MPNTATNHAITYTNSPVLLINTIFKHWNCFLSFVAMDGNDGPGLKREKVGATFSSFNAMPAILWLVFPDEIYLISLFTTLQVTFCVWGKGTKYWLQHRIAHYNLRTADVSPRSSPRRDVSRGGTQLAKRPSMAMSEEAMSEEELNLQNVPQWRWARRNVCRSQATTHSWHSSFKIESLQFTSKISSIFKQSKITLQIYYSF